MNKAATTAVSIAAGVLLIPPTASAGKAEQFEQVFSHYNSIRMALAADSVEGIPYHSALGWYRSKAGVKKTAVVFCPLHNSTWLQRSGDRIGNPYLGETRGRCGEVLQFPQSHWSPGRSPTQSATGDPSRRSG